jgi:hypothetical protein
MTADDENLEEEALNVCQTIETEIQYILAPLAIYLAFLKRRFFSLRKAALFLNSTEIFECSSSNIPKTFYVSLLQKNFQFSLAVVCAKIFDC